MNLNEWSDKAYANSHAHGFWDDAPVDDQHKMATYIGNKLMLVVGEVAEAHECIRDSTNLGAVWEREKDGKPEGFVYELADILIRVFDLAGALDLDLDLVVNTKATYNEGRPRMHGKAF